MRKQQREKESRYTVEQPSELMKFLIGAMTHKSRNAIKSILVRGQVSVNQHETTQYNHPLQIGDTVTVEWNKMLAEDKPLGLQIIHEDGDIIVIHKEAGLLSIAGGKENDLTAHKQLMEYVQKSDKKNRVFIVHRLDRDTSGVMVFARHEKAKLTLQNNWQDAVLERSYIGLVEKQVKKTEGTIESWLKESKTLMMYSSPTPNGGQHTITDYKVLEATRDYSLLEIHLQTGRKNQIRVHMQDIGHPIVGDKKYGSKIDPLNRLGLHAQILEITHPETGKNMRFESPVPEAFFRFFGKKK